MPTQRRGAAARAAKSRAIDAQARYDAAGTGRRIAAWSPGSGGPRTAVEGTTRLRDRAQDSIRNDWASASTTQKWATTLVGVGITPRWKNKALRKLWDRFVRTADADHILDAYGLQTLAVRAWFSDGEVFLRRRPRSLVLRDLAAPVQVQLIESAYCPFFDATAWQGMPIGNEIRQGIEFNKYGLRVAYWMHREHPHDPNVKVTPDMLIRVPASEIRHMFEPKRPGQIRGASELSAMLVRIRSSGDFEDAVIDRQRLANLFVTFITRAMPTLEPADFDPDTGLPKWYDKKGNPMAGLEPGIQQELLPGEDVKFANPPEAGTSYSDFLRSTHLGTAAAGGMPYELLSGDIKDVSDRTLRVVINEFRRLARQRQWQIVVPMHCQPVVEWWADALVLKGDLSEADLDEAKSPTWSPEGWEYIHPTQDAEGKKIELEMGTTSRSRIAGGRGDDIEEIDAERSDDLKRSKQLGLEPPPPPAPGAAPAGPPKPTPKPQPTALEEGMVSIAKAAVERQEPNVVEAIAPVIAEMMRSNAEMMERALRTFGEQMQMARVAQSADLERTLQTMALAVSRPTEVVNNVAPTPVHMHVEPTPLNIENKVEPTPVHMHVEPTPLQVTNNVEVSEVAITSMPARETTTTVARDAQGEIVDTKTVERDATKPKKD
jgi:lambda family phage portal protein